MGVPLSDRERYSLIKLLKIIVGILLGYSKSWGLLELGVLNEGVYCH